MMEVDVGLDTDKIVGADGTAVIKKERMIVF